MIMVTRQSQLSSLRDRSSSTGVVVLSFAVLLSLICPAMLLSQTSASPGSASAASPSKTSHSATHKTGSKAAKEKAARVAAEKAAEQSRMEAEKAAAPPPPDWPVNDKAVPASVAWNGKDLSITATNSSLAQILHDISTATGVKVEGLGSDQRVFGRYGPADARDVIAQLMDGSGYNVMLIGDKGEGTPRQLVLTAKTKGPGSHAANGQPNPNGDDEAVEEPEQPETQPELGQRPPMGGPPQPGQGPRTPQQMIQELQQRQQQQMGNQNPQ